MMRKIIFILQLSFLFSSPNETNLIGENNKVIFKKKRNKTKKTKDLNKENKNENKIAVGIIIGILFLLILLLFQINKEKGQKKEQKRQKKQPTQATPEEKEDFDFLKTITFQGEGFFQKCEKKNKIFENYQQKAESSGLYIIYKEDQEDFFIVKFVGYTYMCHTQRFYVHQKNKNQTAGLQFYFLTKILDFEKFEQKYRNKPFTEEMIKEYVDGPENQRN